MGGMKNMKTVVRTALALIVMMAVWFVVLVGIWRGAAAMCVVGYLFLALKGASALSTMLAFVFRPRLVLMLLRGRYAFEPSDFEGLLQALTRFGWEFVQTEVGYIFSLWHIVFGKEAQVAGLGGVTYVVSRSAELKGVSLGCFVNIWERRQLSGNFAAWVTDRDRYGIYMHEYGHTVQSCLWGVLYLPVVGLISLLNVLYDRWFRRNTHEHIVVERKANRHGARYFSRRYGVDWDSRRNPL